MLTRLREGSEGESRNGLDGGSFDSVSSKDFCVGEIPESCGTMELLSSEGGEEGKRLSPFASGSCGITVGA